MAVCYLGRRKVARIQHHVPRPIAVAAVRGGWPHWQVELTFADGGRPCRQYFDRERMQLLPEREPFRPVRIGPRPELQPVPEEYDDAARP